MVQISARPEYKKPIGFKNFKTYLESSYKYKTTGLLSWFIVSAQDYNEIKFHLADKLEKPIKIDSINVNERVTNGVQIRTDVMATDRWSYTLFVMRVYHPIHTETANTHMRQLYEEIMALPD